MRALSRLVRSGGFLQHVMIYIYMREREREREGEREREREGGGGEEEAIPLQGHERNRKQEHWLRSL